MQRSFSACHDGRVDGFESEMRAIDGLTGGCPDPTCAVLNRPRSLPSSEAVTLSRGLAVATELQRLQPAQSRPKSCVSGDGRNCLPLQAQQWQVRGIFQTLHRPLNKGLCFRVCLRHYCRQRRNRLEQLQCLKFGNLQTTQSELSAEPQNVALPGKRTQSSESDVPVLPTRPHSAHFNPTPNQNRDEGALGNSEVVAEAEKLLAVFSGGFEGSGSSSASRRDKTVACFSKTSGFSRFRVRIASNKQV